MTGNTKSVASKLEDSYKIVNLLDVEDINEPFILFTPTYNFGKVPRKVNEFLGNNYDNVSKYMEGIISFGNRNWGDKFGVAGDLIAERFNKPLLHKVELRGTNKDYVRVKECIESCLDILN